jgi:hypothetical protein
VLQARVERELRHAFVLTADQVRKIWKILQEAMGNVRATASCADDVERPFSSVEKLVAYENPRIRQIVRLEFVAWSQDDHQMVYLLFRTSFVSITLRVHGREADAICLRDNIADILDGTRPWYSNIAGVDSHAIVAALGLFVGLVSFLRPAGRTIVLTGLYEITLLVAILITAVVILSLILNWGISRLCRWLTPMATFALGQGEERYHIDEQWRWVVLIGLVISTLGSVIATVLHTGRGGSP